MGSRHLELPAVQLPQCALTMIEDYRQWPQRPGERADGEGADEDAEDFTFASPTSSPDFRPALAALREGVAAPDEAAARSTVGWRGSTTARRTMVVSVAAALVLLSGAAGAALNDRDEPAAQSNRPPGGGHPGLPPVPWSGAGQRPGGSPHILMNQPLGDGHTVFVVHGRGWTPGRTVTIRLDKARPSPAMPVADIQGTFNYAINQNREFYPGKIPPGVHEVVVTGSGGVQARAKFTVNNL